MIKIRNSGYAQKSPSGDLTFLGINIFIKHFVAWGSTVFGKNQSILVILLWGSHLGDLKLVQTCLKLNKSKITYPIWTNLTFLKNIDQNTLE